MTGFKLKEHTGRKTCGWIMAVVGSITAFYFATVLALSSFDWGLIIPLLLALCLLFMGVMKVRCPRQQLSMKGKRLQKMGCLFLVIALISFVFIEGLIINSAVISSATDADYDYLLVMGAGIRGDQIPPLLEQRLNCALEYLHTYSDSKVIVSGGQGRGETITEAEAMKRYLLQHGIAESRIIREEKATSTFENLSNTKTILDNLNQAETAKLLIISNDFHLFRTTMLAQRLGLDAGGLGCSTALIDIPHCYTREYFAVIKSLLMDKITNTAEKEDYDYLVSLNGKMGTINVQNQTF